MQQATTAKPPDKSAPGSATAGATISTRNRFVINLCSSTSPVSLTRPDHAGLKRFTFFVSRRREEGRERFRLHMGYFESQEEAERLLDIVREIYPGAWAGLAPGQRLHAKAEAAAAAADAGDEAAHAEIQPTDAAATAAAAAAAAPALPEQAAAGDATQIAPQSSAQVGPAPALEVTPEVAPEVATQVAAPVPPASELSLAPDPLPQRPSVSATEQESEDTVRALSNVRAAIASLEDSHTNAPTVAPLPELKPAVPGAGTARASENSELNESGVLRVLEEHRDNNDITIDQPRGPLGDAVAAGTDKTQYAVQLMWSVQPIDIGQIPQLAIFSAYTLYGAEGNRDGRRWYGVRLGFFTDAVSAKQVAHYVRSDFATVSVVPVTTRERERAKLASARPDATPVVAAAPAAEVAAAASAATLVAGAAAPAAAKAVSGDRPAGTAFEFIEDKQPSQAAAPGGRAARAAPGKRAKSRLPRQLSTRTRNRSMSLEETLEILGAGELKMEEARRASINDALNKISATDGSKGKTSRFGRLLERLSGLGS